jgi:hypothetical protein
MGHLLRRAVVFAAAAIVLALTAGVASADGPGWKTVSQDFQTPMFGLNVADHGKLLVTQMAGPTTLNPRNGDASLIASLPAAASDSIQVGRKEYLAVTGGDEPGVPGQASLYRVKNGNVSLVADILAWELANDPDGSGNDPNEDSISNPFDLAEWKGGKTLVADAGGNSILVVDKKGKIDWLATLPYQDIETQPIKDSVGCPTPPPGSEFVCELPPVFTIDPVATTVAVGPDGAIYAGELAGFPGPQNKSRIWRIEPGARHVRCGSDDRCTQVKAGPFTSIIDINFGPDGTAYVVELDEAGWFLGELGMGKGGTVNACRAAKDFSHHGHGHKSRVKWSCKEVATGLPFPTAVAADGKAVYVTLLPNGFDPPYEVAKLTPPKHWHKK